MRATRAALVFVLVGMPAFAHRLDEYLQGTILSVEKEQLQAQMTLTPGVAVFPLLIVSIDTNADGVISEAEQKAYAGQVLHDLSLQIDGHHLTPQVLSVRFPAVDEMKEGRGEIQLDFKVRFPSGSRNRKFTLENHHQSRISAYQVNCLLPRDRDIRIAAQNRNYSQSIYQLEYVQANVDSSLSSLASWSGRLGLLGSAIAILLLTLSGVMKQKNSEST